MPFERSDIERFRGDRKPIPYILRVDDTGLPQPIASYSFLLTVSSIQDPPDQTTELFQISGSITDANAGKVQFQPSVADADTVAGLYYYDIQAIDGASLPETLRKGKWLQKQDITK